nr:MAG TPA: hypothetical protein [Caudoviricetes sp.]
MNIAEILKNCPDGTKLYSSIYGELSLADAPITTPSIYPIYCYFSHLDDKNGIFACISDWWYQCIPYERNEDLLETTIKPE